MFEVIQKQVKDYYDDDARHVFERHGGKIYFIWSNHHNGELFVIICDDTPAILAAIDAHMKAEGSIVYAIKEAMLANGGIKLGEDDD